MPLGKKSPVQVALSPTAERVQREGMKFSSLPRIGLSNGLSGLAVTTSCTNDSDRGVRAICRRGKKLPTAQSPASAAARKRQKAHQAIGAGERDAKIAKIRHPTRPPMPDESRGGDR